MSEYVIKVDENDERWHYVEQQYTHFFGYPIVEEIVRCRDCKFCHKNYCEKRTSPTASPSEIFWIPVEPDGFCKWGEKRSDGQAE